MTCPYAKYVPGKRLQVKYWPVLFRDGAKVIVMLEYGKALLCWQANIPQKCPTFAAPGISKESVGRCCCCFCCGIPYETISKFANTTVLGVSLSSNVGERLAYILKAKRDGVLTTKIMQWLKAATQGSSGSASTRCKTSKVALPLPQCPGQPTAATPVLLRLTELGCGQVLFLDLISKGVFLPTARNRKPKDGDNALSPDRRKLGSRWMDGVGMFIPCARIQSGKDSRR